MNIVSLLVAYTQKGHFIIVGKRIITRFSNALTALMQSSVYEEISCRFPIEINVRMQ